MPLSGPSSYVATIEEFTAHWSLVDVDLGEGNEMTLATGPADAVVTATRQDLIDLRDDMDAAQDSVQAALNQVEMSRSTVVLGKTTLLAWAQAYGRKVRGLYPPGSPFLGMTPELPTCLRRPGNFSPPHAGCRKRLGHDRRAGIRLSPCLLRELRSHSSPQPSERWRRTGKT